MRIRLLWSLWVLFFTSCAQPAPPSQLTPEQTCEAQLLSLLSACQDFGGSSEPTRSLYNTVKGYRSAPKETDNQLRYQLSRLAEHSRPAPVPEDFRCPLDQKEQKVSYFISLAIFQLEEAGDYPMVRFDPALEDTAPFLVEKECRHQGMALAVTHSGRLLKLSPEELQKAIDAEAQTLASATPADGSETR